MEKRRSGLSLRRLERVPQIVCEAFFGISRRLVSSLSKEAIVAELVQYWVLAAMPPHRHGLATRLSHVVVGTSARRRSDAW